MRTSLTAFVFSALAAAAGAAEPLQLAPIQGVVLLRNGQVLSGAIAHTGDHYYVSLPRGEIRLKTSEVDKVARCLEDLYEEKLRRVEPGKLRDRLDLAEWCVEQKLVTPATQELAAAAALEPRHPRIALLQRRLDLAQRTESAPPVAASTADAGPSLDELDRLVSGLPGHAVETFTTTIQPLLVNSCTSSGCHGTRSHGKLRLLRLSLAGPANRRLTQRNLHSVWQVIDVDRPAASPLLTQPIRPHGKSKGPIFSGREAAQYRQLVAWVYAATRQRKPPESRHEEPLPAVVSKRSEKKSKPASSEAATLPDELSEATEEREGQPSGAEADDSLAVRQADQTARDGDYVPVDPFDPEIFNRR